MVFLCHTEQSHNKTFFLEQRVVSVSYIGVMRFRRDSVLSFEVLGDIEKHRRQRAFV